MTPDDPRFHQSWVLLWLCAWTPCLPRCLPPVIGVLVVAWVVVGCYWVCGCRELFGYGCSVLYVLNFLYFSCICLAFRVGIQMLDPSISRADIENRKNVEFSSHCHLAVFAGEKKYTMVSTNMWKKWNLGVHMHMKPCHQHFPSNDFPTHHYRCQVHRRLSPETLLQNYSPKFSHFVSLLRTSISMWLVAGCRARTKTAEQRHANASSKITIGGNCEPK